MYVHVYKNICNVVLPCRFDSDLSACKEDASSEVQAKEQLAREKDQLHTDFEDLKTKLKVCNILCVIYCVGTCTINLLPGF